MASSQKQRKKRKREEEDEPAMKCCPPCIRVWTDVETKAITVENRETTTRHLQVRADAANTAAAQPQVLVQDAAADSELETVISKDQGKVYRIDEYTVHWQAEGQCRPLAVSLSVDGEVAYEGRCLPESGRITLSRAYMLEPPDYLPPGPGLVRSEARVRDCAGLSSSCTDEVHRA